MPEIPTHHVLRKLPKLPGLPIESPAVVMGTMRVQTQETCKTNGFCSFCVDRQQAAGPDC
jgi:hypothetical protein